MLFWKDEIIFITNTKCFSANYIKDENENSTNKPKIKIPPVYMLNNK